MGANSKIEWTTHTFNPWRGCTKVSPGCAHCYAEATSKRNPGVLGIWGRDGSRAIAAESYWRQPLAWNAAAACIKSFDCNAGDHSDACPQKVRPRVFCGSLMDVFEGEDTMPKDSHAAVADARGRLFDLIERTPNLDWLLLTKRPENIRDKWHKTPWDRCQQCGAFSDLKDEIQRERLFELDANEDGWVCRQCNISASWYRENVWLLTSIEDQATADKRIPELLACVGLAPVLGLSIEPLLGPIDLTPWLDWGVNGPPWLQSPSDHPEDQHEGNYGSWVIVGGESGPHARPMHPDWPRDIRDQCQSAGTAFFFKQWGEYIPAGSAVGVQDKDKIILGGNGHARAIGGESLYMDDYIMARVGKKAAGRLLDGREWNEVPS